MPKQEEFSQLLLAAVPKMLELLQRYSGKKVNYLGIDCLDQLPKEGSCWQTQLKGPIVGASFLLIPQAWKQAILAQAGAAVPAEMEEAFFIELDNILSGNFLASFADHYEGLIYGLPPVFKDWKEISAESWSFRLSFSAAGIPKPVCIYWTVAGEQLPKNRIK